jgi:hypothetical protein
MIPFQREQLAHELRGRLERNEPPQVVADWLRSNGVANLSVAQALSLLIEVAGMDEGEAKATLRKNRDFRKMLDFVGE